LQPSGVLQRFFRGRFFRLEISLKPEEPQRVGEKLENPFSKTVISVPCRDR
jgi:hypothetical protein